MGPSPAGARDVLRRRRFLRFPQSKCLFLVGSSLPASPVDGFVAAARGRVPRFCYETTTNMLR
jgi:hypothetical protein